MSRLDNVLNRKNFGRIGWAAGAVLGLYSVYESVFGDNEGLWIEGLAFLAILVGLFAGGHKPDNQ